MSAWRLTIFMPLMVFALVGCASKSPYEVLNERRENTKARAASYAADGFYSDRPTPLRGETPAPEHFFFKKCQLSGRNPYPSSDDWACSEP